MSGSPSQGMWECRHGVDGRDWCDECHSSDEPTDDQIYNRPGVEGGISYQLDDGPGSLGENDWRL